MAWLKAAFAIDGQALAAQGARHDDPLDHALLTIESGTILVESERPEQLHGPHAGRGWVYVTITDADAHYQRARQAGAQVYGEPHDYGGGHRGYSARDLEGNLWTFGTAQPLITPACDPAARTQQATSGSSPPLVDHSHRPEPETGGMPATPSPVMTARRRSEP
jgi:uncharacterized glyoxalase superfamily protein PhnB